MRSRGRAIGAEDFAVIDRRLYTGFELADIDSVSAYYSLGCANFVSSMVTGYATGGFVFSNYTGDPQDPQPGFRFMGWGGR